MREELSFAIWLDSVFLRFYNRPLTSGTGSSHCFEPSSSTTQEVQARRQGNILQENKTDSQQIPQKALPVCWLSAALSGRWWSRLSSARL